MKGASRATWWVAAAILFLAAEAVLIAHVDKPLSLHLRLVEARDPGLIDVFRAIPATPRPIGICGRPASGDCFVSRSS